MDRSFESDLRTFSQMQADESVPQAVRFERLVDEALALTSQVLVQRGQRAEADAMLRIVQTVPEWYDSYNEELVRIWAEYEPGSGEPLVLHDDAISSVFREVVLRKGYEESHGLSHLAFRETLPEVGFGWLEQLAEALHGKKRTNQARIVRESNPRWAEDGLYFTNPGELQVYRALKKMQEEDFPREETIAIFPLARGRIPGNTREPDFIVTYRGRTGVLELDSHYHNGRRSHDTSSEHLYQDAGITFVDRLNVEALNDPGELHASLKRFIRRLREPR